MKNDILMSPPLSTLASSRSQQSYLILVIEDSDLVRSMLQMMLTRLGYRVVQAADGRQGLALVSQINPDLILSDLEMPELDGCEVLEALRSPQGHLAGLAKIPFVLMSGSLAQLPREDSLVLEGMMTASLHATIQPNYYLPKPFQLTELLTAIEFCLV
jgi:CheY-like chemotaxis protein